MTKAQTKKQAQLKKLDKLGTNEFEDELSMIDKIAGDFISRVKTNIEAADMIVSGEIDDITVQRTEVGFDILAHRYLIYQDAGVNGSASKLYDTPFSFKDKRPPVKPIIEWVKAKGIGGDNPEGVAYAIAEKIFQEGMKPRHVFAKEIPKMADDLADAAGNLVINSFLK